MGVRSFVKRHTRQLLGGYVPRDRKIAFIHVPKCGGSSLDLAIEATIGPPRPRPVPMVARLDDAAAERARLLRGADYLQARSDLLLYHLGRYGVRYVSGHHPLPELAYREFHPEWEFVTLFRDPVDRWFSHYFYNRSSTSSRFRITEDLDAFIGTIRARTMGANFLSIVAPDATWQGDNPPAEVVEAATSSLDRFAIAGALEHLDHFIRQFRKRYGARLFVDRLNTNPLSQARRDHEVTAERRERVAELCAPNLEVYRAVLQRIRSESQGRSSF